MNPEVIFAAPTFVVAALQRTDRPCAPLNDTEALDDDAIADTRCDALYKADVALMRTMPTTLAGLAAFVSFCRAEVRAGNDLDDLYMAGRGDRSEGMGSDAFADIVHTALERMANDGHAALSLNATP
jgi:hypothetical protein